MADRAQIYGEIFALFLTVFLTICCAERCVKDATSYCKCTSSKGTIDLLPLASTTGPKFKDVLAKKEKNLYSFNPCTTFTEVGCKKVLGCQVIPSTNYGGQNSYYAIGNKDDPWVTTGSVEEGNLQFQYSALQDGVIRKMYVTLICSDEDGSLIANGEIPPKDSAIYTFDLKSRYACYNGTPPSKGISTGSVLLIIVFVMILVYLIGGFLFLAYARGAMGKERVPNLEFWADFPSLVKEGATFVFRGCKTDSTYDQI